MKNKTMKFNKTKFDYISRKLGVLGIIIIAACAILGGTYVAQTISQNNTLNNQLMERN